MLKWIETTGRSEQDAISAALFQLGLERDDVSVEVIERAKSGFLGFGSNPAKVRVSYEEIDGKPCPLMEEGEKEAPKEEPKQAAPKAPAPAVEETILAAKPGMAPPKRSQPRQERRPRPQRENRLQEGDEVLIGSSPAPKAPVTYEPAAEDDERAIRIREFLTGLMAHLQVQASPEIFATSEGGYKVVLQGENLGAIIGRRGETLDAIQQLTGYAVNKGRSHRVRIHVDAEGYRARREESLNRLARKTAGKVVKYRRNMTLEAMNAYERHVIHTALQDYPGVTTYSTGTEPNRRTVVAYDPGKR